MRLDPLHPDAHSDSAIRAVYIPTGAVEQIDTTSVGKLNWPLGLALNESDRMCYIANLMGNYITAVTLPARYFTVSADTDITGTGTGPGDDAITKKPTH